MHVKASIWQNAERIAYNCSNRARQLTASSITVLLRQRVCSSERAEGVRGKRMQISHMKYDMKKFRSEMSRRARLLGVVLLALPFVCLSITGDLAWGADPALAQSRPEPAEAAPAQGLAQAAKPIIAVNLEEPLGKLPANAFGLSVGNSGHDRPGPMYLYRTSEGKLKLTELGAKNLVYSVDLDAWSASYNPFNAAPRSFPDWMDTDEFVALNADLNTAPILAVNITIQCKQADLNLPPSTSNVTCKKTKPSDAVSWMTYLKSINAPVKNVIMGGEPYAGCIYWIKGINCTDSAGRHRIALPQAEYAARVIQWAKKIKKVNPNVRIGAHLQPNTFLCKNTATLAEQAIETDELDLSSEVASSLCGGKSWDQTVMELAGDSIDFFVVHQYFVIRDHPDTEADAQKLSYYPEQLNMRVVKSGVSAFPSQIRKELAQWLPEKIGAPIVVAEFNASYIDKVSEAEMNMSRQSMYTAMAVGELFLDLLKPVKTPLGKQPGAAHVVLLGMFLPQLTLARLADPQDPGSMITMPSWHVLSMLKSIPGKMLVETKVTNNPKTAVNRAALNVTAVKKGNKVYVAVFNHHTAAIKAHVTLTGFSAVSATATQLGHNASGFLGMNDESQPDAITPQTSAIPAARVKPGKLRGVKFPAHSLTVLEIVGQ